MERSARRIKNLNFLPVEKFKSEPENSTVNTKNEKKSINNQNCGNVFISKDNLESLNQKIYGIIKNYSVIHLKILFYLIKK